MTAFTTADYLPMFLHFLAMSMLSIGGAIATAPDIHRFLVDEHRWLDDAQFTASIALAQAAPGPNLLFVPVLGYGVAGLTGAAVAMAGILLPSTTIALAASHWGQRRRETRGVRAFVAGMAPVTIGMLMSAGTVLAQPYGAKPQAWLLIAATIALSVSTKINPVWLIAIGALAGAAGWV
jgi:chromate transporter